MLKKYLHISFVLKNPLKNVPFYCWAAQAMMWVFLQRKRDEVLLDFIVFLLLESFLQLLNNVISIRTFLE